MATSERRASHCDLWGQAYLIDPDERRLLTTFGGQINTAILAPTNLLILSHLTYLEAWSANPVQWKTRQISWDGIWDLSLEQDRVRGLAWSSIEGRKIPFSVDLKTGVVEGGAYRGPDE